MTAKEVVQIWVERFNEGNAEAIAKLYHEDAINHQVTNDPVIGRKAIRAMFVNEFKAAAMTCIVEHLFEDGDCAILEWKDPIGLRGCGFFWIEDDKIKHQRGYWDKLSFLKMHGLPLPK